VDKEIYTYTLRGDTREIRFSFSGRTLDVEEFPMPLPTSNKMVYISGWPDLKANVSWVVWTELVAVGGRGWWLWVGGLECVGGRGT